jgi:hypothetical protein
VGGARGCWVGEAVRGLWGDAAGGDELWLALA